MHARSGARSNKSSRLVSRRTSMALIVPQRMTCKATYNSPMPGSPIKVLLQTTIPTTADDWIYRAFQSARTILARAAAPRRAPVRGDDARPRKSWRTRSRALHARSERFDEMWLFAVDVGDGLTAAGLRGDFAFSEAGPRPAGHAGSHGFGILDLRFGEASARRITFIAATSTPMPARRAPDDSITTSISWPNFHSGANGDYQEIRAIAPFTRC